MAVTPGAEPAGQPETDHLGQQHGERLAEHAGLRLDAADAPAQHGEPIHHGRMRIGADERIGIGDLDRRGLAARRRIFLLAGPHGLGEIFEIDLVANPGARRDDAEIVERSLAPFQEPVPLAVAAIFEIDIGLEGLAVAERIDDDRMIDDKIDRHQRIDLLRIAAKIRHGVAHRGQIDDGGHAGEILHQDPGRTKRDLAFVLALVGEPCGDAFDVFLGDRAAILEAKQILE